jgi:hypothetical protein
MNSLPICSNTTENSYVMPARLLPIAVFTGLAARSAKRIPEKVLGLVSRFEGGDGTFHAGLFHPDGKTHP